MRRILAVIALLATQAEAAYRTVDQVEVRRFLEQEWARTAPPGATLEIRAVPVLRFREGDPRLEAVLSDDAGPGPRVIPVSCRAGGRIVSRGLASLLIRVERRIWTARGPLARGDILLPEHLEEKTILCEREPARPFSWDPARKWEAVRSVAAGARITSSDVRSLRAVEAGDEVLLVVRTGTASVSVSATARRSGDVGETILVHNPISGVLVEAVVAGPRSAELVTARSGKENR